MRKVGDLADAVTAMVTAAGGTAKFDRDTDILRINGTLSISVFIAAMPAY